MKQNEYAFIIPSLNPDDNLIKLVHNLLSVSNNKIFIVNDGSKDNSNFIFNKIKNISSKRIYLLENAINMGKGASLKMVFNFILTKFPLIEGVVTLDSDGQHLIKDCIRILEELKKDNKAFVLGYRTFSKDIPLKSYIGNNISKFIYKLVLGRNFKDTQTGLRGLSRSFMIECLRIKSNRFEFETEQLALSVNHNINIIEIPIETIYIENNKASSFKPFVDSFKIYFVLFRYGLSSMLTAITDFIVFLIALQFESSILVANMLARTVALFVQFKLLNVLVFKTNATIKNFLFYILYVYLVGMISIFVQLQLSNLLTEVQSKIIVEVALFFINFTFLRLFIFRHKENK
jgi:hypothetical protein